MMKINLILRSYMLSVYKYFVFFLVLLKISSCGKSDLLRIRILSPMTENKQNFSLIENKYNSNTSIENSLNPYSIGSSVYTVFGSIGFGITSTTTSFEKETRSLSNNDLYLKEKVNLETNFNDFGFLLGENYTIMWGYGVYSSGKLKLDAEYGYNGNVKETIQEISLNGSSNFLILGHHGSNFETLLGVRINNFKAELNSDDSFAKSYHRSGLLSLTEDNIEIITTQVQLGIGFTF